MKKDGLAVELKEFRCRALASLEDAQQSDGYFN